MRFDKYIEFYKTEKGDDGLGGHEEIEVLLKGLWANVSNLSTKYALEVFGETSTTALSVITRESINKKECSKVKYNDTLYNVLDIKPIKNKFRVVLEVLDND